MGNQTQVLDQIWEQQRTKDSYNPVDQVRKAALKALEEHTNRSVISYYSGWLHGASSPATPVADIDMQGFMLALHQLPKDKGVDLILHTPGGGISSTESIVEYLFDYFGCDIRAIVPQQAMSAGTMIALSCKSIVMGKHSRLGPIDPQIMGVPSQALLEEFRQAIQEIKEEPASLPLWQQIISKYPPTVLTACEQANEWSKSMVSSWLSRNMCEGAPKRATDITEGFSSHREHKAHSRQLPPAKCIELGVEVVELEADGELQDRLLTLHHAYMHTLAITGVAKIIESSNGETYMLS